MVCVAAPSAPSATIAHAAPAAPAALHCTQPFVPPGPLPRSRSAPATSDRLSEYSAIGRYYRYCNTAKQCVGGVGHVYAGSTA